ncbi:PA2779 family protein [Hydrogenobacter thermophilus]|uniref:PA2779 family protein n=1 Tax=Hydrogenobacter thermophilus TaxID=940 RepID=UPI0030F9AD88
MMKYLRKPALVLGITGTFFFTNSVPALAGLVESKLAFDTVISRRDQDMQKIQRALESKILQEKLKAYGLSKEEIQKKLSELNDEQIHMLAKASDKVLAGGDGIGVAIAVVVLLILIVILLKLLNKEIIIR